MLSTANARYSHAAFGLKRLQACLHEYKDDAHILEFTIQQSAHEMAESILALRPWLLGLGVYIWNVDLLTHVVEIIRGVNPKIIIVLGGPEMFGDLEESSIRSRSDHIITGEAEIAFYELVRRLRHGEPVNERIVHAGSPDLDILDDPYDLYTEEDIAQRVLYVESSRGCPYRCVFCLSGGSCRVRYFNDQKFIASMSALIRRGARSLKFTDRTFNVDEERMRALLCYFKSLPEIHDMRLHFEIMPDRLSEETLRLLADFPPETLHLEVGIQSINTEVQERIFRNQDIDASIKNMCWLVQNSGSRLHADLIMGLPGETLESFEQGFNLLVRAGIHEIQVGLLKNLPGTSLRQAGDPSALYDRHPPYELLQNEQMSFETVQRMKRFAKYFDLFHNHGNFPESLEMLWEHRSSCFDAFLELSERVWEAERRVYGISLARLAEHLHSFMCSQGEYDRKEVSRIIEKDYRRMRGRRDVLPFLV